MHDSVWQPPYIYHHVLAHSVWNRCRGLLCWDNTHTYTRAHTPPSLEGFSLLFRPFSFLSPSPSISGFLTSTSTPRSCYPLAQSTGTVMWQGKGGKTGRKWGLKVIVSKREMWAEMCWKSAGGGGNVRRGTARQFNLWKGGGIWDGGAQSQKGKYLRGIGADQKDLKKKKKSSQLQKMPSSSEIKFWVHTELKLRQIQLCFESAATPKVVHSYEFMDQFLLSPFMKNQAVKFHCFRVLV